MVVSYSTEETSMQLTHGEMSWREAGEGEPLVLLHGIGSSAKSWTAQIEHFAKRHRVVAWNAPGYGESSHLKDHAPTPQDYADVLTQFLDALKIERAHIVGHSLGALMAARFAAGAPGRVRTLTLASCAIGHAQLPTDERQRLLLSRVDDVTNLGPRGMAEKRGPRLLGPNATPDDIRKVIDVMAEVEPAGYAQAARMLSQGDMLGDLAELPIGLPLQIVYGTADVITPEAVNLRAAAVRPGTPVAAIPDAGHALYVEAPQAFNTIVEDFVRRQHV
jgi:pimeloyl-ACP methyl ester carboxylesterase